MGRQKHRRRRRPVRVWLAAFIGGLIGLWMLAQLRVETPRIEPAGAPPTTVSAAPTPSADAPSHPAVERPAAATVDLLEDRSTQHATLEVELVDSDGAPAPYAGVQAIDCQPTLVSREGRTRHFAVAAGTCELAAVRRDGALIARGESVRVSLAPGERGFARLELPARRTGCIGIAFEPGPEGIAVKWVIEGSPAHQAGLEAGDRIVAVSGVPVEGLNSQGFVDLMTGPEGSDVEFELEFDADTGTANEKVVLRRAFLSG